MEEFEAKTILLAKDYDDRFLEKVLECRVNPAVISRQQDMSIIYTPLHGTGYRLVPEVLRRAGFENVTCVPSQMVLSGQFPTVALPNPEYKDCFIDAMKLANEQGADFIIGTDPDADRVGVVVRKSDGEFEALSGNQTGALLLDYILRARKETGNLPANAAAVKSIVSTEMTAAICRKYGVTMFNVLTGFKFIGEKIKEFEADHSHTYVFGFEESYGYLTGTYARDKDAVAASLMVSEMAAYYREKGMTLADAMDALYAEYGVYVEKTVSIAMKGVDAPEKMKALMRGLRSNRPETFAGISVESVHDLEKGAMGLPPSNVLYYRLTDGSVLVVRPSGTEPKVKIYVMVSAETRPAAEQKAEDLRAAFFAFAGVE